MYKTLTIKATFFKFRLFLLFYIGMECMLLGQSYISTHYGVKDGLNSEMVHKTVNLSSGELYIATQRGIALFDGTRFILNDKINTASLAIFPHQDELFFFDSNALQSTKYIHSEPKIWLNTKKTDNNPNNDHYENLFIDSSNRIWSTDFENLKYLDPSTKNVVSYPVLKGNKELSIYASILENPKGEIWYFSPHGIWKWKSSTQKVEKFSWNAKDDFQISSVFKLKNESIQFSTNDGKIYNYNWNNNQLIEQTKLPQNETVLGIAEYKNQLFYLCSDKLYVQKNNQFEVIYQADQSNLKHLNLDSKTGTIWISSSKGLIQLTPIHPNLTNYLFDGSSSPVISITKNSNDRILAVNSDNEIWQIQDGKTTKINVNFQAKLYGIYNSKNELFLATQQGIYQEINGVFKKLPIVVDSNHAIISTFITPQNEFWVVYATKEMDRYSWPNMQKINRRIQNDPIFWTDNKWQDIQIDENQRIWLAGWMPKSFGITYYQPEKESFYDIADKKLNPNNGIFVGDYFTKIGIGLNGNLLFSAFGGWNETDRNGKLIKRVDIHQYAIMDSHIRGITSDQKGNVYFATGEGLHVYRPEKDQVYRFSKIDGFPTDYLVHSFFKDHLNRIYVGFEGGISEFNLENVLATQLKNPLKISQILVNGKPLTDINNNLILNKNERDLIIQFSDYNYLPEGKVQYRYRFSDENKWHILEKPELNFNHISPGKYEVEFQEFDNLGNVQAKTLKLEIHAKPPFLKSNLFYGILILALFGLVFGINQYLWRKRHEKQEDLRKIKEAEMRTLRSQMNPHFLFNTLNSINSYIILNKTDDASSYLTTFSKLMRNILDNSKHEQISLKSELDSLKLYLKLESVRLEHSFDYVFKIDPKISQDSIMVPPLIIQPFAENSIWHGLRTLKSDGILEIIAEQPKPETLILSIKDNGIGRKASSKLKQNETQHKSYGIAITIDRIKSINPKNTVEILDLYDHQNPIGTLVKLTLNLNEND